MIEATAPDPSQAAARGAQIARNTMFNLAGNIFPLLIGIVCTPGVVRRMSPDDFGVLTFSWALLGYAGLFDLGVTRALTKHVAARLGRDSDEVNTIAWTAFTIQVVLGLLSTLVLVLVTPILTSRVLNIAPADLEATRLSFYFLALSFPAVLAYNSLRGLLEASQNFLYVNLVRGPFNALNFLWPFIATLLGYSLPIVILGLTVARVLAVLAQWLLCRAALPELKRRATFDRKWARALLAYGSWVTVSNVVSPILVYVDRFIIGAVLTMAAVGYYGLPLEIVSRLAAIPASLVTALFPVFSRLDRTLHGAEYQSLLLISAKYVLILLGPATVLLIAHARPILTLWIDAPFAAQTARTLQILSVGFIVNALALLPFSLLQGSGRPDIPAKLHVIELPIHLVLVLVGVKLWGLPGAAAAWTLRVTLDAVLLYTMCARVIGLSFQYATLRYVLRVCAVLLVMVAAAFGLAQAARPNVALAWSAGLAVLVWAFCWFYALAPAERGIANGLFRRPDGAV